MTNENDEKLRVVALYEERQRITKTWPEIAYCEICADNDEFIEYNEDGFWVSAEETVSSIEYIRADVAAEREKKLIRLARQAIIGFYKNSAASVSDDELYEAARLERLK